MKSGELVSCLNLFPGVSSLCAFGCKSGSFSAFDSETNEYIFQSNFNNFFKSSQKRNDQSILSIEIPDEKSIYAIDKHNLARFDIRDQIKPIYQTTYEYEIFSLSCSSSSVFAVASKYNSSVITYDNRNLQRKINEVQLNSIPPSSLCFFDNNTLIVGYEDSTVGIWNVLSEEYKIIDIPQFLHHRNLSPLSVLKVYSNTDNYFEYLKNHENESEEKISFAIGYQSGFTLYNYNGSINSTQVIQGESAEHRCFSQRGKFGKSAVSPCLGENYIISIVDDSTLLPVSLNDDPKSSLYGPKTLHGSSLTDLAANKLLISAIEDDDEGYISVFLPESFVDTEI